jgi:hypothetical protein
VCLVRDDIRVPGVGLDLAAVTVGGPVHQAARQVEDLLAGLSRRASSNAGSPSVMSITQVTGLPSAKAKTSPMNVSSSGSSLATRRDSNVVPSASRARPW